MFLASILKVALDSGRGWLQSRVGLAGCFRLFLIRPRLQKRKYKVYCTLEKARFFTVRFKVFLVERPGVEPGSQSASSVKLPPLALPIIPAAASRAVALARCVLRRVIYILMPVPHSQLRSII